MQRLLANRAPPQSEPRPCSLPRSGNQIDPVVAWDRRHLSVAVVVVLELDRGFGLVPADEVFPP